MYFLLHQNFPFHFYIFRLEAGDKAQSVKCLPYEHENRSSTPPYTREIPFVVEHAYETGIGRPKSPQASLSKKTDLVTFRFSGWSCAPKRRWKVAEQDTPLNSIALASMHICMHIYVPTWRQVCTTHNSFKSWMHIACIQLWGGRMIFQQKHEMVLIAVSLCFLFLTVKI